MNTNDHAPGSAAYEQHEAGFNRYPEALPADASEYMANGFWQAHDYYIDSEIFGDDDEQDAPFVDEDDEPFMSAQFEHDSAMTSIGWGTDEDYGYYGEDDGGY